MLRLMNVPDTEEFIIFISEIGRKPLLKSLNYEVYTRMLFLLTLVVGVDCRWLYLYYNLNLLDKGQ